MTNMNGTHGLGIFLRRKTAENEQSSWHGILRSSGFRILNKIKEKIKRKI